MTRFMFLSSSSSLLLQQLLTRRLGLSMTKLVRPNGGSTLSINEQRTAHFTPARTLITSIAQQNSSCKQSAFKNATEPTQPDAATVAAFIKSSSNNSETRYVDQSSGSDNHHVPGPDGAANSNSVPPKSSDPASQRASLEELITLKEILSYHLPRFLAGDKHPYSIYTPSLVFENFYKEPGTTSTGLMAYAWQLTKTRILIHWKYSHARLEILKITHDQADSTVKVRWRVNGVGGLKSMVQPWKMNVFSMKKSIKKEHTWHDGFSILYVRGDGLVYKHRMQRVQTQDDEQTELATNKKPLVTSSLDVSNSAAATASSLRARSADEASAAM